VGMWGGGALNRRKLVSVYTGQGVFQWRLAISGGFLKFIIMVMLRS
jgi:hypothetical protein